MSTSPVLRTLPRKFASLGPWALVTGASDGIGAATACELAKLGFNLILVARRTSRLDAIGNGITRDFGAQVHTISADLGKENGVRDMLQVLDRHDLSLDEIGTVVLAAGYGSGGAFAERDIAAERDMVRVNCDAVLQLSQVFARAMAARGAGQLVLFGSIVGFQGTAMASNYAATKAYVQTLAEGLAVELKPSGVHVLAVSPGPIASGFATRAKMTMGQAGTPEEVGRGIVHALGRSGTIRPGFLSKLLGYNMAMTPRPLRIRIMSAIMGGMVRTKPAPTSSQQEA